MNRTLFIPAVPALIATALFASCEKAATVGDSSFARRTFESLAKGDKAVEASIDWEMLRFLNADIGQVYVSFASDADKIKFREGFITQFASKFQAEGGKVSEFTNWRVRDHDKTRTVVAADSPSGNLLLTVNKRDGKERVSAIEITR